MFKGDSSLDSCPELQCSLANNRSLLPLAEAIIFHAAAVDFNFSDIPKHRSQSQRFVFMSHESPLNIGRGFDDGLPTAYFNWTMTYRLDSDIPFPFAYFRNVEPTFDDRKSATSDWLKLVRSIRRKTRPIVWFVSNCKAKSYREQYVKLLQNFIPIDIYGKCGKPKICLKGKDKQKCAHYLINRYYRFYIAFENSVCKDYITEKFFLRWTTYAIPIVLDDRVYSNFPPKSVISAEKFKTPKDIANFLRKLESNLTEYQTYFEWRRFGAYKLSVTFDSGKYFGYCGLCQRLWTESKTEIPQQSYRHFDQWWINGSRCDSGDRIAEFIRDHFKLRRDAPKEKLLEML